MIAVVLHPRNTGKGNDRQHWQQEQEHFWCEEGYEGNGKPHSEIPGSSVGCCQVVPHARWMSHHRLQDPAQRTTVLRKEVPLVERSGRIPQRNQDLGNADVPESGQTCEVSAESKLPLGDKEKTQHHEHQRDVLLAGHGKDSQRPEPTHAIRSQRPVGEDDRPDRERLRVKVLPRKKLHARVEQH